MSFGLDSSFLSLIPNRTSNSKLSVIVVLNPVTFFLNKEIKF